MGDGPFPALDCSQGFRQIRLALGPPAGAASRLYAVISRAGGEGCGPGGYLGTFRTVDVYRLRDAWAPNPVIENASFNLPNAMVFAMGFSGANGRLRVATHGRGIWELQSN